MKEKTLFYFNRGTEDFSFYFEIAGDFSHLHNIYINSGYEQDKADELEKIVYDANGEVIQDKLMRPTKDWTFFVHTGIHYSD